MPTEVVHLTKDEYDALLLRILNLESTVGDAALRAKIEALQAALVKSAEDKEAKVG